MLIYESGIYVPPRVLKMEGLGSGPSLENEGDFGTKNSKETYILREYACFICVCWTNADII